MDAINTLRGILAGGAALAAVVAGVQGRWGTVLVLGVGLVAHGLMWRAQFRARARQAVSPLGQGPGGPSPSRPSTTS